MNSYLSRVKTVFQAAALAIILSAAATAQTQDTSGNGLLKGTFAFRHVAVLNVDGNFDPSEVQASFGTIKFDGAGNYTLSGSVVDNTVSNGATQALSVTGTYAIGGNGAGYIANPAGPSDFNIYIYGAVSQGVFAGSATESQGAGEIFNDIFIAIPLGAAPTNASFTAPYQTGLIDFSGGTAASINNALFELIPNGSGGFGAITLNGQSSAAFNSLTQVVNGATYSFGTNGSATLTIPLPTGVTAADALFTGAKTMYQSADGNFVLGWSPAGFDIFFGVKALASPATNSISAGLYFTSGLEDGTGFSGTDSFYGGTSNSGDANGDGIVHARLNLPFTLSFDFGTDDTTDLNSDGSTPVDLNGYQYLFGDGGAAYVGIGTNGFFSLVVGLHAASFSGSGVYLNPIGVVNAASYQPITASLAPGELITLFGTGLASGAMSVQGGQVFPKQLGGVSVTINGIMCPIYYVSATQLSVIVPYGVATNSTGLANIQVINGTTKSNVVQMYLTDSAPGSFSQTQNGLGLAAALHAATGQLITPDNPAQADEYISLYLTGLGTVTPAIQDGALGPSSGTLSTSDLFNAGNLAVLFNDYDGGSTGNPGNIQFAGLAPGLAGLYQINVQVPPDGVLQPGDDVYLEFVTDAADVNQIQIPYGTAPAVRSPAAVAESDRATRLSRMIRGRRSTSVRGTQRLRKTSAN